jgi:hypothetical protein
MLALPLSRQKPAESEYKEACPQLSGFGNNLPILALPNPWDLDPVDDERTNWIARLDARELPLARFTVDSLAESVLLFLSVG